MSQRGNKSETDEWKIDTFSQAGVLNKHGNIFLILEAEDLSIDTKKSSKHVCTHKAIYFYDIYLIC